MKIVTEKKGNKATYKDFSRNLLEGLSKTERQLKLKDLSSCLTERLKPYKAWEGYWNEVDKIIGDLRAVDHDLWSHDYDGERKHLWGWDYMRLESAGFLQIEFDF